MNHHGFGELTFPDSGCRVAAERVLLTVNDAGLGALRISPGHAPSMSEIITAFASGPFTVTVGGRMITGKPLHWTVHDVNGEAELLMVFEPEYAHSAT